MTEQGRPTPDPQPPQNELPFPFDAFRDELEDDLHAVLDPELLKQAREYVQQRYDASYWEHVKHEAEAFWDRRYDPTAPEDW